MADLNTCAHEPCKCLVAENSEHGEYCSEHCKEAADQTELVCDCKCAACR